MAVGGAADVPRADTLTADVCIIGGGAAGLTLAADLDGGAHSVVVLEAGGAHRERAVEEDTFAVEHFGEPWRNPEPARGRSFGGSANLWFGRLAAPQPIDFDSRPWVPASGWPIERATLTPWLREAAHRLRSPAAEHLDIDRWPSHPTIETFHRRDDTDLAVFAWAGEPDVGGTTRPTLERSTTVRVLLDATVTALVAHQDGRALDHVEVARPDGGRFTVTARAYVLAAGGLENPRLLLASTATGERGLGNDHDLVGRYYMDHPRGEGSAVVDLHGCSDEQLERVRFLGERTPSPVGPVQFGVTFSARKQRDEGLLNHVVHGHLASDEQTSAGHQAARSLLKRVRRRDGDFGPWTDDVVAVVRDSPALARLAARKLTGRVRPTQLIVIDQMEQEPDRDSRVTVDHRKPDRFGLPRVGVDWHIGESTYRSQTVMHETLRRTLAGVGLTSFRSRVLDCPDEPRELWDMKHPSGTTRMATSPTAGVVDADGRVHGLANLYIVGSSTFPTVGHFNPTLTILALTLRLGDHLRRALRR